MASSAPTAPPALPDSTAPTLPATSGADPAGRRTLLFRVGTTVYGCAIDAVREIVPYRRATRLPGAPEYVQGLVNLRGTIVTVVDLGAKLERGRAPVRDGSIIMVSYGARSVGVAVEEVMDVRSLTTDRAVAAADAAAGVIRGLGHADELVVVVLDIHALIQQVLLS